MDRAARHGGDPDAQVAADGHTRHVTDTVLPNASAAGSELEHVRRREYGVDAATSAGEKTMYEHMVARHQHTLRRQCISTWWRGKSAHLGRVVLS